MQELMIKLYAQQFVGGRLGKAMRKLVESGDISNDEAIGVISACTLGYYEAAKVGDDISRLVDPLLVLPKPLTVSE